MGQSVHVSVLSDEVILMLQADRGGVFLDCTFGGGGHACAILRANQSNQLYAIDRDPRAIERSHDIQAQFNGRLTLRQAPFSRIQEVYPAMMFDGVLADLGLSTDQLHEKRGFSFADAAELDMRMDPEDGESAASLINRIDHRELSQLLRIGGIGAEARVIASEIIRSRPFNTAQDLAECIKGISMLKAKGKKTHPATVVFQAIRIAVNREFEEIEALLEYAPQMVKPGGRLAIITFHSLEDKLVTRQMRAWENEGTAPANYRGAVRGKKRGSVLTRKPICPSRDEVARNPASRSAQLRVFEFAQ